MRLCYAYESLTNRMQPRPGKRAGGPGNEKALESRAGQSIFYLPAATRPPLLALGSRLGGSLGRGLSVAGLRFAIHQQTGLRQLERIFLADA